ncbi:MAG: DHHA1 domain-containing protein [Planctomycetia bacterium]|nr:DHHA1 domain-containing protein [Planctomycetia bacterium]
MSGRRRKHWCFRPGERDQASIGNIVRFAKIPPVLAKLLVSRGVQTPNDVARHLDPRLIHLYEPNLLPGCARAAMILVNAVREKKKIAVYGDYDVDGMTATSILVKCLKLDGGDVMFFIPNRQTDGYGLNADTIRDLKSKGVSVIVTVDCGITAVDEVKQARELGMTVIVTDHHQPGACFPEADAIVHPNLFSHPDFAGNLAFEPFADDPFLNQEKGKEATGVPIRVVGPDLVHPYPFPSLSGAGVAFKLAWAVCQRFAMSPKVGLRRQNFIFEAIALAAIGTIADVVSLTEENRVIVVQGLARLREKPSVGLAALLKVCKLYDRNFFESEDIGFSLAPRLNAAGRLEQAWLGVDLLTMENEGDARDTALYLDDLNDKRKELEKRMYLEANNQLKKLYPNTKNPTAIVLASHEWHPGIIGIVAGKLAERYNAPTVLIALSKTGSGFGTGSARGIANVPEFNLHEALSRCGEHLERFGGHAGAAGLKIAEKKIAAFRDAFCAVVDETLPENKRIPQLWIDSEELLSVFTLPAVQSLYRLAPFGTDNPAPVFATSRVSLERAPDSLGKQKDTHLTLTVRQLNHTYRILAFQFGEDMAELTTIFEKKLPIDIAFRPMLNSYNGVTRVAFHLVDWKLSDKEKIE